MTRTWHICCYLCYLFCYLCYLFCYLCYRFWSRPVTRDQNVTWTNFSWPDELFVAGVRAPLSGGACHMMHTESRARWDP